MTGPASISYHPTYHLRLRHHHQSISEHKQRRFKNTNQPQKNSVFVGASKANTTHLVDN